MHEYVTRPRHPSFGGAFGKCSCESDTPAIWGCLSKKRSLPCFSWGT